ncbi:MAG: D-aminoacylase [Nitrospirae bacterium]|nr:D-aminoacylase [Nitrospirota bacterium]
MNFDFLIQGGIIINGAGADSEPIHADIAIEGDRIRAIGDLSGISAKKVVNVKGFYICPGFIDAHSHSEFTVLADGRAEGKICQGVTTEINGNCGLSAAPLYGLAFEQRQKDLEEFGIKERWNSFHEYFAILNKKGITTNFITLAGHGNLRASQVGYSDKKPSREDISKMRELLRDAISAGAKGLSTGLIYPPGIYADTDELIELAKETALHRGIYTSHMRSEGDRLLEAIDEVLKIGFEANISVHISHLKTSGRKNWGKINDAFRKIEDASLKGLNVSCDRYPYTAGGTDLDAILPSWAYEGGHKEELKKLKSSRVQERIKEEILREHPEKDYWDNITISAVNLNRNKWMEGRKLSDISGSMGKGPLEFIFDFLIEEDLRVGAIFFSMNEDNLKLILKQPYTMIGSDSSARSFDGITARGKPHPRGFGSFPRILSKYVKEQGIMTIEDAVYKMSGLPARTFGIRNRGVIAEGFFADITIFDPDRIEDKADFDHPFKRPDGIYYVFVNGVPALWEGRLTGKLSGRIL